MCTEPGTAPCSYSSGSRTSSSSAPWATRASAPAVSTSRICALVALSSSRKFAMEKSYKVGRVTAPSNRQRGDGIPRRVSPHDLREHLADRPPDHDVREVVHLGRLAVDDHDRRPVAPGDGNGPRDRVH